MQLKFVLCMIKYKIKHEIMNCEKIESVTSHNLYPLPHVTNCHTFSDPSPPWSVTYFMDGPILGNHLVAYPCARNLPSLTGCFERGRNHNFPRTHVNNLRSLLAINCSSRTMILMMYCLFQFAHTVTPHQFPSVRILRSKMI